MRLIRTTLLVVVLLEGFSAMGDLAQAQVAPSCTASATPIALSSAIDPVLGGDGASTGAITVRCSGVLTLVGLSACIKISPAPAARVLTNARGSISYGLYQNSAFTIPWGDVNASGLGLNFTSLVGVNGVQTATAYLKVNNAATAIPGTYTSDASVTVAYSQVTGLLGCNAVGLGSTTTTTFAMSADVKTRCTVAATPLAFGSTGLLTSQKLASANLIARCSNTTPYTITLGDGLNSPGPGLRAMKNVSDSIRYELFRDIQMTSPWSGPTPVNAVGSGLDQSYPVYGRVPPQTTPAPGLYTDRVVVTISY